MLLCPAANRPCETEQQEETGKCTYNCVACDHTFELTIGSPVRCEACNGRILAKVRTALSVEYVAR